MAYLMSLPSQFRRQIPDAFAGPTKRRPRIPSCHRLQQFFQIRQESRIFEQCPLPAAALLTDWQARPRGTIRLLLQLRQAYRDRSPGDATGARDQRNPASSVGYTFRRRP